MPNAPAKILVVDDDPVTATLVTAILQSSAYDVKSTESGETALDVLAVERFDLLVTDLRMPGIGGIGLIQEIATRSILQLSRILVITGEHTGSAACRTVTDLGIAMLQKPVRRSELLDAVKSM